MVTVGSCFSDVIGRQLERYKVPTLTNPFGTLFNPLSACKLLQICAGADVELADSFVQNNGRWYSYDFHSSFSAETEEELYEQLDEVLVKTRRFLKKADVLILTLGTANIFRLNITGETVANCHKLPAGNFTRETLLPEEIITAVAETHSLLRELNPNLKLVLTVSPVRHLKDTLELNSVSKSVLRLATHFLTQNLPDITYFPAYELLLDDLRDYRFYKEDLLHPTPLAETYIWEKFTGAYFEEAFRSFTAEWDSVLRGMAHKPFHPESGQHQQFIQQMLEKLRLLQEKTDVTEEMAWFEKQVIVLPEPVAEEDEEDEDEEEAAEEEIIPGYFSEEPVAEEIQLQAEPEAPALTEAENPTSAEGETGRKKKKKPRKKKRKPAAAEGEGSLAETGTAKPTEIAEPAFTLSEPAEELAAILDQPNHPVAHYGETLSERPLLKKPLSKSAKRRESRRKKKALSALESTPASEITTRKTDDGPVTETLAPKPEAPVTFEGETPGVFAENESAALPVTETIAVPFVSAATLADDLPTAVKRAPKPKKTAEKSVARKKKPVFSELFVPESPASPEQTENQPTPMPSEIPAEPNLLVVPSEPLITEPAGKPKPKGRAPKAAAKTAKAIPVSEKIAVPFVPAATLTTEAAVPGEDAPKKRGRTAKPKTPPVPANTATPETAMEPTEKAASAKAKPGRKKKVIPAT